MGLTDTALRSIKPSDKQIKLFDGHGLFLLVSPKGTKAWRLKYYFQGKEKLLSLGLYPTVSLKEAREKAVAARKQLEQGLDPSEQRKLEKAASQNTLGEIATEWVERQKPKWSESTYKNTSSRVRRNITGPLAAKPIGRAERDPAADLKGALTPVPRNNLASLTTPEKVGHLLIAIDNYPGSFIVRKALQLMSLTFTRTDELRRAEWKEIHFEDALWRIPAEKMKMKRDHIVPLSTQAISILKEVYKYSRDDIYIFPNYRDECRCMSKGALLTAIRKMEFEKDEMCHHGFRSMASTMLNEMDYNADWIERQLAHVPRNIIRGIYNRAEYLPERRKMMQDWANYLDDIRLKIRNEQLNITT